MKTVRKIFRFWNSAFYIFFFWQLLLLNLEYSFFIYGNWFKMVLLKFQVTAPLFSSRLFAYGSDTNDQELPRSLDVGKKITLTYPVRFYGQDYYSIYVTFSFDFPLSFLASVFVEVLNWQFVVLNIVWLSIFSIFSKFKLRSIGQGKHSFAFLTLAKCL